MSHPKPKIEVSSREDYKNGLQVDVAIIGAGVSGLYTGYRLLNGEFALGATPPETVHIFELSDRIGGRLESVNIPGLGDVVGELGGMRYMTSQKIVTSLIEEVFKDELTSTDFPMGESDNLLLYLRKQQFKANDWEEAQGKGDKLETRYYLNDEDVGYSADQLFNKVVYDVLMADPWFEETYGNKVSNPEEYEYNFMLTSQDWNDIKPRLQYCFEESPYHEMLVNDIGFWNLIKDRVSQEGYQFLADAGGYYSNTINWNAAEAFPYMVGDFSNENVTYKTIGEGYDKVAFALGKGYTDKGGSIWLKNALVTFDKGGSGDYPYSLTMYNINDQQEWKVSAKKIVLALPRRSLELLDQYNFFFDPENNQELQKNIQSIFLEPSYKLLMAFEECWWRKDFSIESGHSITDLPMRQCYYFGVNPVNNHSLFLASYNDMRTVPFWDVLEEKQTLLDLVSSLVSKQGHPLIFRLLKRDEILNKHPHLKTKITQRFEQLRTKITQRFEQLRTKITQRFEPKKTKSVSQEELNRFLDFQASQIMVHEAMNQVKELHNRNDILDPYISYYKDWSEDPFGGGYHAWKAKIDVESVMKYMRKPMNDEDIHICGEAYSDQQGWVEGALCVAERMLEDYFSMERPDWLDKDYYLGW